MESIYSKLRNFKKRYPLTIGWFLTRHAKVIEKHINPDEEVLFAFAAQKTDYTFDFFSTNAIVLTNKRILLGQKRLFFGYFYTAITPDMFNDLKVSMGLIWGKVYIDTVKELVTLSKLDGRALDEIETAITEYMMEEKKKYTTTTK